MRELDAGRLRQGWGYNSQLDLRLLRKKVSAGKNLDEEEAAAWRNRRLLDTEPDGLKPGDVVVLPNLPDQGRWVLARVIGPYSYAISRDASPSGPDYGHIVPVEPIRTSDGKLAVVEADNEHVDARLRASMRNMGRMWSIDTLASSVEHLIAVIGAGADTRRTQPEELKFQGFFAAMRDAAWQNISIRYKGAELEKLVERLFQRIYPQGRVEHWGGAGEKGADLIVFMQDVLGLEYKIAVQVKLYDGVHDDTHALDQIKRARLEHKVDAGVVVTTATETSDRFEQRRAALEADLAIDVRVVTRDEMVELIMTHLGGDRHL